MPFSKNFTMGSIYPYDAHSGFAYTPRPIQKTLPVTLDSYFLDPITGAYVSRMVWASIAGNVVLEYLDGSTDTITLAAGEKFEVVARRVKATGTTATGLHWGY